MIQQFSLRGISLPVQLFAILLFVTFFGNLLSPSIINILYSLSLIFKELLSFLLPWIVFSFISTGILAFKKNAPIVLGILLFCIVVSNSIVAFFSYFIGKSLLPFLAVQIDPTTLSTVTSMTPFFSIKLPVILKSETAMLSAVVIGMTLSFFAMPRVERCLNGIKSLVVYIINKCFIPILPFYVLGFLLEIHHQGVFIQLFQTYGKTFALIIFLQFLVLFLIYFIAARGNVYKAIRYINVAIPSYLTAFGTMSSTATIPVTVQCAQINTKNKNLSEMATPILANIHLLGDAISTPILALVTLFVFRGTAPSASSYCVFVAYFCINMLAVSGIPGGGIIVMIPILKAVLGFDDIMVSIITTLYFLQDGLGTAGNVMGDGALIIIINKILKRLKIS